MKGDAERPSDRDRAAFEQDEQELQTYQNWPGLAPQPADPARVLEAR